MKYERVLLKLSGETLAGAGETGINLSRGRIIAEEIQSVYKKNVQIAVVIGAGNIWRGAGKDLDRVTADNIGMLATVMNSLALGDILRSIGVPATVLSAFEMPRVAELYVRDRALQYLGGGTVAILAGGTGNPFFTTDTTAALRAAELNSEVLLKATQVDGIYDDDPKRNPGARRFSRITFDEAIQRQLKIMDTAAFSLCRENHLPIVVFNFYKRGNLAGVLSGQEIGTLVSDKVRT